MIYSRANEAGLTGRKSAWSICHLPGRRISAQLAIWMPTETQPVFLEVLFRDQIV